MSFLSRYRNVGLHAVDALCIAHLLLIGFLLLFFHSTVPDWPYRIILHLGIALGILEFVRFSRQRASVHAWRVARTIYPVAFILFSWRELQLLVPMLYDGSYWMTDIIVKVDQYLFGDHPTVLIQQFHRPWLDELMSVLYTGYFLFFAVPVVLLAQRQYDDALSAYSIILFTVLVNFVIFLIIPTKSPPQILAEYPGLRPSGYTGYFVAELTRLIQMKESVTGAAFPSSHVSGAFVCSLVALRWLPRLGFVLLPLACGIAVSTVYLGYHHAVDPMVGMCWGVTGFFLASRWFAPHKKTWRSMDQNELSN